MPTHRSIDEMTAHIAANYGYSEANPFTDAMQEIREKIDVSKPVYINDPDLARVIRLRLLTDRDCPQWDLSYIDGQMKDGTYVRVIAHAFGRLRKHYGKPGKGLKAAIIAAAKQEGVFAKGLGLLDDDVISVGGE